MTELTRDELTARAGVAPEYLDRLLDLGNISPNPDGRTFSIGALRTTRMIQTLQRGGLPLEGIGAAAGLPPARVGIGAGPLFFQDGGYFGRTVNTAARIAAYARAGEVR